MAFTDIMGQYMDRRLGDIQDRYNQVGGLLSGDQDAWASQFGLETEEEKKKVGLRNNLKKARENV